VIHAALQQAVVWGWIARNPADHADPGEILEDEIEPPEDVDIIRILAEAEDLDARLAVYLLVAAETGARRGAIHALRWTHLDLKAGVARFPRVIVLGPDGLVERPASRRKKSGRKVALSPYCVAALVAHQASQAETAQMAGGHLPADAHVFSDDPLGERPWRPDSTDRKFRQLRSEIGMDEIRLHDFRHYMATTLLAAGVDPKTVAQRGGWSRSPPCSTATPTRFPPATGTRPTRSATSSPAGAKPRSGVSRSGDVVVRLPDEGLDGVPRNKDAAPEPDGRQLASVHQPVRETGRDAEQASRFIDRERQVLVRAFGH
jgi:integrase